MASEYLLQQLVRRIHAMPELAGCMIGFQGMYAGQSASQSRTLHEGFSAHPNSARVIVVIEECELSDAAVLAELRRWASVPGGSPEGAPNPTIVTNRSRLGPELIGAGLSCGLTIVSAIGVAGGVAAEVPTGGASTFLVVASWTGLVTQGIQCANGAVRVVAAVANADDNTLQRWDEVGWYSNSILVVDALGVASGVASLPFAVRNLWAVFTRQRAFVARGLSFESLKRLNRAQRLRVISEVFEEASRTPEGRAALVAAARESGFGARAMQGASGLSVRQADSMVRLIGSETARRLTASLRDVLATGIGTVASGTPAALTGSASGSVNYLINLIDGGTPGTTT